MLKNREKKLTKALEAVNEGTLTREEIIRSFISFKTEEAKREFEETAVIEATKEILTIQIGCYGSLLKFIEAQKEATKATKDSTLSDLYYLMSFLNQEDMAFIQFVESPGWKIVVCEDENIFYEMITDIVCKDAPKPYGVLNQYFRVVVDEEARGGAIKWEFDYKVLKKRIKSIISPFLHHPVLWSSEYKNSEGILKKKTNTTKSSLNSKMKGILTIEDEGKFQLDTVMTRILGAGIDSSSRTKFASYRRYGELIKEIMDDLKAKLPEMETYVSKFDHWLHDHRRLAAKPLDSDKQEKLRKYLEPFEEQNEQLKTPGSDGVVIIKEPTTANIQPVSYQRPLPPITGHVPNTDPKKEKPKTRGEVVDTEITAEEDEGTPAAPRVYIEEVDKSSWIWSVLHGNHPDYDYIKREFHDFLQIENLAGEWVEKENKGAIAIVSPIDGVTYVETFHDPHGPVGENSYASWRLAVKSLLKAASIVRS
ncbi:MAG: hypothetical protein K2Q34_03425 [Alphaproteobacteria bacterium]|nr:hypothetical protein [Alphaproteobacteria bacterium]